MPLLHRILMRLGIAWLALVGIGTAIAIPLADAPVWQPMLVGAFCATPSAISFALAWVFKPA